MERRQAPIAALAAVLIENQNVIHITYHLDMDEHWQHCPHTMCVRAQIALVDAGVLTLDKTAPYDQQVRGRL